MVIGPTDGAAAKLVRESDAGVVASYNSPADIERELLACAHKKLRGEALSGASPGDFVRFERGEQARELARRLDGIAERSV